MNLSNHKLALLREYIDLAAQVAASEAVHQRPSELSYARLDKLWELIEEDE